MAGLRNIEGDQNQMVENMGYPYVEDYVEELTFTTKSKSYIYKGEILEFMSKMDLSSNKITGEIPSRIENVSKLHALNLSHNNLWGSIPATFSSMKDIESPDLS